MELSETINMYPGETGKGTSEVQSSKNKIKKQSIEQRREIIEAYNAPELPKYTGECVRQNTTPDSNC